MNGPSVHHTLDGDDDIYRNGDDSVAKRSHGDPEKGEVLPAASVTPTASETSGAPLDTPQIASREDPHMGAGQLGGGNPPEIGTQRQ